MLVYWALRGGFALSRHVPLRWQYRLGRLAGLGVYWCWPAKRRATRRTMAVVMDDQEDGPRARAAARAALRNYGRFVVDFLNMPALTPHEVARRSRVEGWEHMDRAVAAGKGVIVVTGHLGLWDYAASVLTTRYPGRIYNVVEPFASPRVDALIQGQRAAHGSQIIPMTGVRQMVRVLRGGGILTVLVDRPVHNDGVPVRFFGRYTTVPAGAATLAALTGAALVPGCLLPGKDDAAPLDGLILPVVEPSATGNRAADVQRMTQGIFAALERMIRRNPQHWYMFRDMWAGSARGVSPAPAGVEAPA